MTAKTATQLKAEAAVDFPDNTTGQITPAIMRSFQNDVVDSFNSGKATDLPFAIKGSSSGVGTDNDIDIITNTDAIDNNGAGTAKLNTVNTGVGVSKNGTWSTGYNANLYIERNFYNPTPGTPPWQFGPGYGAYIKCGWPGTASEIGDTNAVTTTGGSSAGKHAPENTLLCVGVGFGDTVLETSAYGGMIDAFHSHTFAGINEPTVFPKYNTFLHCHGTANDSQGFLLNHEGVPPANTLFRVSSSTNDQGLMYLNGPLNAPAGSITAGGSYADLTIAGRLNLSGGDFIGIDPLVGTTFVLLQLTSRNSGAAKSSLIINDLSGNLLIQPLAGTTIGGANPALGNTLDVLGKVSIGSTPAAAPINGIYAQGAIISANSIKSSSSSVGIGYATGAGSTIAQGTNRTTAVNINAVSGAITLFSAAGSTTPTTFTVNNTSVADTDTIIANQKSGTDLYHVLITAVATNSFNITFYTTGGTTTETPVFNFNVIKGVSA